MAIQWRPMRPRDIHECVEIVAASPIQAPRYGAAIHELETVWKGLLGRESFRAIVLEETQNHSRPAKVGVGVSTFISDDFLHHIKTPPFFWVYPELMKWIATDKSPLLTDKQTREANANGDSISWFGNYRPEKLRQPCGNPHRSFFCFCRTAPRIPTEGANLAW